MHLGDEIVRHHPVRGSDHQPCLTGIGKHGELAENDHIGVGHRGPELWRRRSATAGPSLTLLRKRGSGLRRRIAVGVVLLLLALGVAAGLKVYEYTAAPPGAMGGPANRGFAAQSIAPALQIVEP